MSTKKLLVLTAVFLALLGFVVFFERFLPTSEEAAKARKRLVDFKPDVLTSVAIERPGLPAVELTKSGKSRWLLGAEPADGAVVSALLSDLGRLDVVGDTRTDFDPKEFGLDVPRAKVTISSPDAGRTEILFGKEIPGTDTTAAAAGGRFGAVRFAPVASLVKPLDDFRSKVLFDTPAQEITKVTVTRGPSRVVVSRAAAPSSGGKPGDWRIEEPVQDIASRAFVEQLLADLSGARISEFPSMPAADMPRVGLQPPLVTVELQKGSETVASLGFGAARADAAGKLYAKRGKSVVVVDDRIQEDLAKEFTAYREKRLVSVDAWSTARVSIEAGALRTGAERTEGVWLSAGKPVPAAAVEDLLDRIGRTEGTAFVARKDFPSYGLPATGRKLPAPAIVAEVTPTGEGPRTMRFYDATAPGTRAAGYVVDVSGRSDALFVERASGDEIRALAAKVTVAPPPKAPAPTKPAPPAK